MTFTAPTEDIIVQEGTFAFDYDASGTVYAGQGVKAYGTMQVMAPGTSDGITHGCVGVSAYQIADGNAVAVYGPGNICRVCISSSGTPAVAAGDLLVCTSEGTFTEDQNAVPNVCCSGVTALALEATTTQHGNIRVLLR